MKRLITALSLLLAVAALLPSCGGRIRKAAQQAAADEAAKIEQARLDSAEVAEKEKKAMEKVQNLPEEPVFDIITNCGTMVVKLYKKTPRHRDNFAKLALSGFYDGLLFHRVINGFMIQGGDPLTKDPANADRFGTGGPNYTIPAEFVPEYRHAKGALAAARRGDAANPMKESSGSQFYIVQNERNCAQLDGAYTVFGQTIDGLKTIDKIASVETDRRDRPVNDVKIITIKLHEEQ